MKIKEGKSYRLRNDEVVNELVKVNQIDPNQVPIFVSRVGYTGLVWDEHGLAWDKSTSREEEYDIRCRTTVGTTLKPAPEKVSLAGGAATSTKIPQFGLMPRPALVAFTRRLELGLERHKEKSWNAQSPNYQQTNDSLDWVLQRLNHVIDHALNAIEKLTGNRPGGGTGRPWDGEDDAGAIMFGGATLACSTHWQMLQTYPNAVKVPGPTTNTIGGIDRSGVDDTEYVEEGK